MGVDLDGEPKAGGDFAVERASPPFARTLPYLDDLPLPAEAVHLGVRLREKVVGQVIVFPLDGVAGIYSMGVAPKVQGRGIGLVLTKAALRLAWERDCQAAVLNATAAGERLYARAGFRSLGWGQTWWPAGGPTPTERQIAITEAVGFGEIEALKTLDPSESEAAPTLFLAAVTGQAKSIDHLLIRFPTLTTTRFPPRGGNLLHVAVEHDQPEVVAAALCLGVDPEARDSSYDATPQPGPTTSPAPTSASCSLWTPEDQKEQLGGDGGSSLPMRPSELRPGRLVAALAGCGRHETPGT